MAESSRKLIESLTDLLKLLECPVCQEYPLPPTRICTAGHFVCGQCRTKVPQCPICRQQFSNIKLTILDQICEALIFPCNNFGCGTMVPIKDLHSHLEECPLKDNSGTLSRDDFKNDRDIVLAHNIHTHIEDCYSSFSERFQLDNNENRQFINCQQDGGTNERGRFTDQEEFTQCFLNNLFCRVSINQDKSQKQAKCSRENPDTSTNLLPQRPVHSKGNSKSANWRKRKGRKPLPQAHPRCDKSIQCELGDERYRNRNRYLDTVD